MLDTAERRRVAARFQVADEQVARSESRSCRIRAKVVAVAPCDRLTVGMNGHPVRRNAVGTSNSQAA